MGQTDRHGSDYSGKPEHRIPRADIIGAERAVEESILSTLGEVALPCKPELSLVPERIDSLKYPPLDDIQSLGKQALVQEI